jgi:hypothetical protein
VWVVDLVRERKREPGNEGVWSHRVFLAPQLGRGVGARQRRHNRPTLLPDPAERRHKLVVPCGCRTDRQTDQSLNSLVLHQTPEP